MPWRRSSIPDCCRVRWKLWTPWRSKQRNRRCIAITPLVPPPCLSSNSKDPPNALLSIFEEDAVNDVVVILTEPKLSNGDLSFAVEVTDGDLIGSDGAVSLFIDMIGRPLTPVSIAGGRRRGRRRARRRMRR